MVDFRARLEWIGRRLGAGDGKPAHGAAGSPRDRVADELEAGGVPDDLRQAITTAMQETERLWEADEVQATSECFERALQLSSHRVVHFDAAISPLVTDPVNFAAPFRESVVARAVRGAVSGRASQARLSSTTGRASQGRPSSTSGRTRVVVGYRRNADFLGEIEQHLAESTEFDARTVNFNELPGLERFRKSPALFVEQVLAGKPQLERNAERHFREHLDWADVAWIEWCTALAALMTRIDPGDTRIVVRLHSYEVFSHWPHLVNWQHVHDVVFVSEHLRDLAAKAIPGFSDPGAPELHVLPLAMELRKLVRPKQADARFNLALLGASKMVKDPRWAIEVLRLLREHDERYRLLLIGGKFQDPSEATREYAEALRREESELAESGALERIRYTEDVPGVLERVGVILSTSFRESFHIGLVEGAASGAVPVVRDWPFFPGAPKKLFPEDWVVETPEQAAARILALTADEETWLAAGREASRHVVEKWDWEVVKPLYDEFLRRR